MLGRSCFIKAFYSAMNFECGGTDTDLAFKYWLPEVKAGLIDTKEHRAMVGYTSGTNKYNDSPYERASVHDRGGETKFGIAQHGDGEGMPADFIKNLTLDQASERYEKNYWNACRCYELPELVAAYVYDIACGSGPRRAIVLLQRAVGVADDGAFGPMTMKAVQEADPDVLLKKLVQLRLAFYQGIVNNNQSQGIYLQGWNRRANTFINCYKNINSPEITAMREKEELDRITRK